MTMQCNAMQEGARMMELCLKAQIQTHELPEEDADGNDEEDGDDRERPLAARTGFDRAVAVALAILIPEVELRRECQPEEKTNSHKKVQDCSSLGASSGTASGLRCPVVVVGRASFAASLIFLRTLSAGLH